MKYEFNHVNGDTGTRYIKYNKESFTGKEFWYLLCENRDLTDNEKLGIDDWESNSFEDLLYNFDVLDGKIIYDNKINSNEFVWFQGKLLEYREDILDKLNVVNKFIL